jgi:hypothetical protein
MCTITCYCSLLTANDPTDDAVPLPTAAANVLAEPAAAAGIVVDVCD